MNHIYRLVWNRAKRVMQVTSEIGGSTGGDCVATTAPGLRRTPLALACAGLLGLGSVLATMPAAAADVDVTAFSTPLDLIVDTAGPGNITQTGAISVGGTTNLTADGMITLTNAGNDFTGAVSLTGGTTAITDGNALTLGTLATGALTATTHGALNLGSGSIGGSLEANSNGGAIEQTGALVVAGDMSLDAGVGGDIVLTDLGNDFQGALDLSAVQILLASANDLHIASLTTGVDEWVVLLAGGTLTLATGAIDTGAGGLFLASNGGSLASTSAWSGFDVSLAGRDGITLGDDLGASGLLVLSTTNAAIVQGAGNIVAVDAQLDAGTGAITLTGASNDFTGTVDLYGGSTEINDATALTLGTFNTGALTATSHGALNLGAGDIGGALAANSNNGAISQVGALAVTGSATINAGTGAITLTNAGNDFTGAVGLTGGLTNITDSNGLTLGTLATGALTATSIGALNLGSGSIGGAIDATSNGGAITQGGALTVTGSSTIDAGTGMITLTNVGNDFQGSLDVSGASIAIADANDLDIAALGNGANGTVSLDAGGVLTLVAGDIDTGTGNLILQSAGGALATPGALSGNNISLYAGDGLTIASDITAGGGITLFGGTGSIVQTSGTITGLGLAGGGATAGDIVLNSVGNSIGMLGGFEAASFSLVNNTALLIDEHSTITGDMRIDNGISTITLIGTIDAGRMLLDSGFMRIGNGTTVGTLAGDLVLGGLAAFQHSDDIVYAGDISGSGTLNQQGTGALVLDGDSSAFAGDTQVQAGTLVVGGSAGNGAMLGGDVAVTAGATLGGHGSIGGDVDIANGATLAPGNSIGTLTIDGNLHLAQGSTLDYEFGAPGANFTTPGTSDRVDVGGNLAIDGATLDVTDAGGMGAGLYTVLSWGGTLTQSNGGLSLGTVPGGQDLQLQFLGDRINVLSISGLELNFWNANGAATSSQLGGGSGTWSATAPNWTDADATATAAMNPQPGFAIFGGASGTVTVDDGAGAVAASGLQFASNGYRMTGDTLTLVGSGGNAPVIRVGDGSVAGASMTATIDNVIAGTAGLDKADAGTLVLAGANTYSGGTTVSGGILQVGSDANLGAAGEGITLDGGTLATTGSFATARGIAVGNAGGGLRTGADMTLDGAITGAGILHTAGTITLTNAGNAFGGASIDAGTLALSGAGTAPGTLVVAAGATFDISQADAGATIAGLSGAGHVALGDQALTVNGGTSIFDGVLDDGGTGGGSLVLGSGTLTLTGANTYTGATTIAGGATLALAGGGSIGASSPVQVDGTFDIAGTNAGALIRDLRGTGTVDLGAHTLTVIAANGSFDGTLAGDGVLALYGGTLTLNGASTYTGVTAIGSGATLALAGTGSIADSAQVIVEGTFDIAGTTAGATVIDLAGGGDVVLGDQTLTLAGGDGSFAGDITGTGAVHQLGGGTQVLLGTLGYTGGTTLDAGSTLQVGDGGTRGSLSGAVVDNGTLAFDRSDAVAFDGAMSGNGLLRQQGSGTLLLGGNSAAFAGATQVASGRLVVGGSAGSSAVLGGDVSVAAGAILGGHGRIGGNVVNAGTVAPGNSIGILTIGGDYTQTATGALQIEAQADGQADKLVVEGSAALDGSMLVLAADGDWRPQTDYTILTAAGGISGQFGTASSSLVFLDPLLAYGTDAVTLTLRRNDIAFASAAATANQTGVAAAADALGWGNPVYTALTTLDATQAAAAFDVLSGEIHAATRGALLDDSRHLEQTVVLQSASAPIDARGAWVSGWGHWGQVDGDSNAAKLDSDGSGIAIGGGIPLGEHARIGAVIGTGKLDVRSDARASHSDVDSRHAGIHVRLDTPVASLQAGVLRSWHDIDSRRTAAFAGHQDSLQANADADTTQVFVDASRVFDLGDVQLIPFANIARVKVRGDAFDETGGAAALHVDAGDVARTLASVGLHGEWRTSDSARLWASVGWMHASGDDAAVAQQGFVASATPFTVAGPILADNTAQLDVGMRWQPGARTTLEAAYNGRFGDGLRDQGARVSLRWAF